MHFSEWNLLWRLGVALALSSTIGLEREVRQKNAGMRTYALVGTGAALIMLVSTYGFADVLRRQLVVLDPSRIAAQVVSGIGFIGGGLIFVQRANVRGLTTAAGIWTTAAIGLAAGAGLPVLAGAGTLIYLLVSLGYPYLTSRLPAARGGVSPLRVTYLDGSGLLRELIKECAAHGFAVADLQVEHQSAGRDLDEGQPRTVTVNLELRGRGSVAALGAELDVIEGVVKVHGGDANVPAEA